MQAWVQFGVPMEEMGPIFEMLVSNVQVIHFNLTFLNFETPLGGGYIIGRLKTRGHYCITKEGVNFGLDV